MFPLSPVSWIAVGGAILIAVLGAAVKVQTSRLDACKAEFQTFQAQVKANGELAEKVAKEKDQKYQKAMEDANAKSKKVLADNAALGKRLREQRAASGYLPKPAANTGSPERACFDRAKLERAIADLDAGFQEIAGKGDDFKLKLSTAAEWAKSLQQ